MSNAVPPDGRRLGDFWRSPTTRLSWGTNSPGYRSSDPAVFKQADVRLAPPSKEFSHRFREDIGGQKANIQMSNDDRFFMAFVRWNSPSVWLYAESDMPSGEAIQLAIFRTVRFTPRAD